VAVHPRGRRGAGLADHVLHAAGAGLSLHPVAAGFARAADVYERARPEYPPEAVAWLVERLGLRPDRVVVDVAAGTGKLTRLLVPSGARVVAVEPLAEMRAQLEEAVPCVEALEGAAEALPLPDDFADAITVAAAFHWFRAREALAEFARVLRRGGRLAIVYNLRDPESDLQQELTRMLERHGGSRVAWMRGIDDGAILKESGLFGTPEHVEFRHEQRFDPDGLVERVSSISYVALLEGREHEEFLAQVRKLGERQPSSPFAFPYVTQIWASRASSARR
jgi:SAM-dependent methyltransferase